MIPILVLPISPPPPPPPLHSCFPYFIIPPYISWVYSYFTTLLLFYLFYIPTPALPVSQPHSCSPVPTPVLPLLSCSPYLMGMGLFLVLPISQPPLLFSLFHTHFTVHSCSYSFTTPHLFTAYTPVLPLLQPHSCSPYFAHPFLFSPVHPIYCTKLTISPSKIQMVGIIYFCGQIIIVIKRDKV